MSETNICAIAQHLRGGAGAHQIESARIGLTRVVGVGSARAVHTLEDA
jgi:acetyl-CoA acyltransferase